MKISIRFLFLILLAALPLTAVAAEPEVIYWNSDAGKVLRARIAPDEDYWQLIPWFTNQENQTYCGVASAVTVLNAMPIKKPVDPVYAPYAYFTQRNFFTPEVVKVISPQTVRNQGTVSYTHLRAHETVLDLVCRLLLEKKKEEPLSTYK